MAASGLAGGACFKRDRGELPGLSPPGSPPHSQGAQEEGAEEHDDADDQQVSRPFAATPTIPSTIAAITSSRNRAIIGSSAQPAGSAAGQPPLTAAARLVGQAVVLEDRLFVARGQLAVGAD
jgi:hypothetical protein